MQREDKVKVPITTLKHKFGARCEITFLQLGVSTLIEFTKDPCPLTRPNRISFLIMGRTLRSAFLSWTGFSLSIYPRARLVLPIQWLVCGESLLLYVLVSPMHTRGERLAVLETPSSSWPGLVLYFCCLPQARLAVSLVSPSTSLLLVHGDTWPDTFCAPAVM